LKHSIVIIPTGQMLKMSHLLIFNDYL